MATRKAARAARARTTKARTPVSARSRRRTTATKRAGRAPERRKQAPETLRLREFQPGFTVNDIERSVRFYSDVLGFVVSERWTDGGALQGVMLKAGVCQLGLSQDDWAKGRDRQKGQGVRVWCQTVQDVDALATRITKAGWTLTEGPTDQPWGARSFSLEDPDGYHLTIYRKR